MSQLDDKINQHFAGLVVRKDLVKAVKGNAIVPSYVLEYLLGQYCATNDESTIQTGIETVKEILRKHYVHRNEAGLVRSTIKEKGRHKVIDRISVSLNDKDDVYEAEFANLGIKKVLIDSSTVKAHQKLLVGGVWCIADLEYDYTEDKSASPWVLASLKPIQISRFDFDGYLESRKQFTTDEWIDLLIQSIGFNPQMFGKRNKLLQLIRLIPFCERNYNLIELGPKGTGKSHVYSEFSPHGILISGGEVTVPKLFVHNGTGKLGLVGYWDVVAFDEFAGKQKRVDKALVDIMKNYMANKSFSRGWKPLGPRPAWCSWATPITPFRTCSSTATCSIRCRRNFTTRPSSIACTATYRAGRWTSSVGRCSPAATALSSIIWPRSSVHCAAMTSRIATKVCTRCRMKSPRVIVTVSTRLSPD